MVSGKKIKRLKAHAIKITRESMPEVLLLLSAPTNINAPVNKNTCTSVGKKTANAKKVIFPERNKYPTIIIKIKPMMRFLRSLASINKAEPANAINTSAGMFPWVLWINVTISSENIVWP